jgi:hypothetical protein
MSQPNKWSTNMFKLLATVAMLATLTTSAFAQNVIKKDFSYAVASIFIFQAGCRDQTTLHPSTLVAAEQHFQGHRSEVNAAMKYIGDELKSWERESSSVVALEIWCPVMKKWIQNLYTN